MNIGFVGLGAMGQLIVPRLMHAGHRVTGWNRSRDKAEDLVAQGMRWADTPRSLAAAAGIVFTMVSDAAALSAIADGPDGLLAGLRPGSVLLDMSTISPAASRALAERVREAGAEMMDAPVSGSVTTLQQGNLSVMAAGRRETFERVRPLLLDLGPKVTYMGDNGLALAMKIAVNLSLTAQMLAFSEGVLLAEKSGIARETAVEVLTHSAVASPMLQYRGPFVLQMPKEAWFNVKMMQKDLLLALDMGRESGVPLPTVALANEFLTAARAMGFARQDFAVVFQVLAQMSVAPH